MNLLSRSARAVLSAVLLLVLAAAFTSSASAKVVKDSVTGAKIGAFPSIRGSGPAVKPISTACSTSCTPLTFHAGGVVQRGEKEYLFFWTPSGHSVPSAYRSGLATWLNGIAKKDYTSANPISVSQQYYDLSGPSGLSGLSGPSGPRGLPVRHTSRGPIEIVRRAPRAKGACSPPALPRAATRVPIRTRPSPSFSNFVRDLRNRPTNANSRSPPAKESTRKMVGRWCGNP